MARSSSSRRRTLLFAAHEELAVSLVGGLHARLDVLHRTPEVRGRYRPVDRAAGADVGRRHVDEVRASRVRCTVALRNSRAQSLVGRRLSDHTTRTPSPSTSTASLLVIAIGSHGNALRPPRLDLPEVIGAGAVKTWARRSGVTPSGRAPERGPSSPPGERHAARAEAPASGPRSDSEDQRPRTRPPGIMDHCADAARASRPRRDEGGLGRRRPAPTPRRPGKASGQAPGRGHRPHEGRPA